MNSIRIFLPGVLTWTLMSLTLALWPRPAHAEEFATGSPLHQLARQFIEVQESAAPAYSPSPTDRASRFASLRAMQNQLKALPRRQLSERDALSYDLLSRELDIALGFEPFPDYLLAVQHVDMLPARLADFGNGQSEQLVQTVAHYDAYLQRISLLPQWSEQVIANLREGMRRGVVLPKDVIVATLPQLHKLALQAPENPFYAPVTRIPVNFSDDDRLRLSTEYRAAFGTLVIPAIRQLSAFLANQYLPHSRKAIGLGAMPGGLPWYRHWIRAVTGTKLLPDEIHRIGLREVARIQRQLAAETSDVKARTVRPPQTEDQILAAYRSLNLELAAGMAPLFLQAPVGFLDIAPQPSRLVEAEADHATPAADDGERPAIYWVALNHPAAYDTAGITARLLRTGRPGRQFQLEVQQALDVPAFRKRGAITAFGEGWALYAASLGHEMGLYSHDDARLGALRQEMAAAAHLVVDTGIHARRWSRKQAIDYLVKNASLSRAQAQADVARCMAKPGQALAAGLGYVKIRDLRERAARALGADFKLAAFHDAVLREGALPLDFLDKQIEDWIAARNRQGLTHIPSYEERKVP